MNSEVVDCEMENLFVFSQGWLGEDKMNLEVDSPFWEFFLPYELIIKSVHSNTEQGFTLNGLKNFNIVDLLIIRMGKFIC